MYKYLENIYVLTLSLIPGVGKATIQRILNQLNFSPSNLSELHELFNSLSIKKIEKLELEDAFQRAEKTFLDCKKHNINIIGAGENIFPLLLKSIPDPPIILYVKGNIDCLKPENSVAIIGTREPSQYGKESAFKIAKTCAEKSLIIVSGLAIGCDTAAHEGCLSVGGQTVAVLAHGLDTVYPPKNQYLAKKILDLNGCLVSEYTLGTKPFKHNFVQRNRIQSGLSSAVVIAETDIEGGTMHTANFCLEQGKILACINHPSKFQSDKSKGNQKLINEGKAIGLSNPNDLEVFLNKNFAGILGTSVNNKLKNNNNIIDEIISDNKTKLPELRTITQKNKLIFEIFLDDEEISLLQLKCAEKGLSKNEFVKKLINNELSSNITEIKKYSSQSTTNKSHIDYEQLPLLPDLIENNNKEIDNCNGTLNQTKLAEKLKVSTSTIRKKRQEGYEKFKAWSCTKDPDGFGWEYVDKSKRYKVAV